MIQTTVTLVNLLGLHARASAKFVTLAAKFQSRIEIKTKDKTINGKSIMGVMTLGATQGSELVLIIDGPDEGPMEAALVHLINNRFGEAC